MFSRRRFRRLLLGVARASQPSCRRLLRSSDASCRCGSSCSALHHCAPAATTASADFCPAFTGQISRGKTRDLRSIYPSHLRPSVRVNFGLRVSPPPPSPTDVRLLCASCSSGRSFASELLPHPASRRRSCSSARGSCHQGPQRTFTSKSLPARLSPRGSLRDRSRFAPCPAHGEGSARLGRVEEGDRVPLFN